MRPKPSRDSPAMLAGLAIVAFTLSVMSHEALGHGGYCLAVGGHTTLLTPWSEVCRFPGHPQPGIKAAGPGVQFCFGLLTWWALSRMSAGATNTRYLLWLCMTLSLFISSGYLAFSGVLNVGDAAELIAPLGRPTLWRGVLVLLGAATYVLSMKASAHELNRFAGDDHGIRRLFRLVWVPYVSVCLFACCTLASNRLLGHGVSGLAVASPGLNRTMGLVGLALASSFGAGLGMFGLPPMTGGAGPRDSVPSRYVRWTFAWAALVGATALLFLFVIGPGVR